MLGQAGCPVEDIEAAVHMMTLQVLCLMVLMVRCSVALGAASTVTVR